MHESRHGQEVWTRPTAVYPVEYRPGPIYIMGGQGNGADGSVLPGTSGSRHEIAPWTCRGNSYSDGTVRLFGFMIRVDCPPRVSAAW